MAKIIPIFKMSNGKPIQVSNELVAEKLLKKKDSKGNAVYTMKKGEAKEAAAETVKEKKTK